MLESQKMCVVFLAAIGVGVLFQWGMRLSDEWDTDRHMTNKWQLSHAKAFAVAGALWPNRVAFLFSLGVLWEVFEHATQLFVNRYMRDIQDPYWYADWTDIHWNALGLCIGVTIHAVFMRKPL